MFDANVTRNRGMVTVRLTGELDIDPAPGLKDCFDQLVEQGDTTIEVDLRRLTYCDSTGISALIHGYDACRAAGGQLRITGEFGAVARILDLTEVRGLLTGQGASAAESPTVEPARDMDPTQNPDPPGRREPEPA